MVLLGNILSLLGGLSLFLFGMKIMGKGLEELAGARLGATLERMTGSRGRGLVLGTAVTAVMQSSSAVTVMAVGFVNAEIMTLSQATGIIMGANIGTTVTAWLFSLTHLQGTAFFLQLFKASSLASLAAIPGALLYVFSKHRTRQNAGQILLGFAVLIFGMDVMSEAMSPLAEDPHFSSLFLSFANPLLGIVTGTLLTALLQSSSASVGILQSLSRAGQLTGGAAIPLIMGLNIGTCATTLLSCMGGEKNAKRAAMIHLYFNLIGTVLLSFGFYTLNGIFHYAFVSQPINAFGIALIHSAFNLLSTALLFPFGKELERLAYKSIPDGVSHTRRTQ